MNKDKNKNLLSSVTHEGRYVTQIIHFKEGYRKTIHGIDTLSIEQGQFTKFKCKDGRYIMINDNNVLMVEVFSGDTND
tara:strand:- start:128 stop:361 length:234 start_codon:yes stop_codon:yes gene_type:complete